MENHLCSHCGQPHVVQMAHKETLSKLKAELLMYAGRHVATTNVNRFKKRDIEGQGDDNFSWYIGYSNWPKLRYHGLIARAKDNGKVVRGQWVITRNGWAFLRGKLALPKYVIVQNNHIKERSDKLVKLTDVWRGADYLETTFEYFDDEGQMVGLRPSPVYHDSKQGQGQLFDIPAAKPKRYYG